jgi:hypothetical protein
MIIAVDTNDSHGIADHAYRSFRTINLGLDSQFFRGR